MTYFTHFAYFNVSRHHSFQKKKKEGKKGGQILFLEGWGASIAEEALTKVESVCKSMSLENNFWWIWVYFPLNLV
jgi:hypothetical protein